VLSEKQKKIERAYQRAMNIRDSSPITDPSRYAVTDSAYGRDYRLASKRGDVAGFTCCTRIFLKFIRSQARAARAATETPE
jgi:hypothetical protein